jgi:hypothetical protein
MVLIFLVALAVGSLAASGLLVLIPEVSSYWFLKKIQFSIKPKVIFIYTSQFPRNSFCISTLNYYSAIID